MGGQTTAVIGVLNGAFCSFLSRNYYKTTQVLVRGGFRVRCTADDVITGRLRSYINTKYYNIIIACLSYDATKTAPRAP